MKCRKVLKKISAYMDGELSIDMSDQISRHLRKCPECMNQLNRFQQIDNYMKNIKNNRLSASFLPQLIKKLSSNKPIEKMGLASRILKFFEHFFDLLMPEQASAGTLDEFSDFPPNSLGHIYINFF